MLVMENLGIFLNLPVGLRFDFSRRFLLSRFKPTLLHDSILFDRMVHLVGRKLNFSRLRGAYFPLIDFL